MNNKDMPAMPLSVQMDKSVDDTSMPERYRTGLTKLEHFAGLAMQGLITLKGSDCQDADITANQCVRMAKALLSQLDKE